MIIKRGFTSDDGNFTPIEAGMHTCVCYGIIDVGIQENKFDAGKESHRVVILWETQELLETKDGIKKPRILTCEYTLSLNERSTLFAMLTGWRGKPFTDEELEGFDLKQILGKPCLINVQHHVSKANGRIYARVSGVSPLLKGMAAPKQILDTIYFTLDKDGLNKLDTLPSCWQRKIQESKTYKLLVGGGATTKTQSGMTVNNNYATDENLPF